MNLLNKKNQLLTNRNKNSSVSFFNYLDTKQILSIIEKNNFEKLLIKTTKTILMKNFLEKLKKTKNQKYDYQLFSETKKLNIKDLSIKNLIMENLFILIEKKMKRFKSLFIKNSISMLVIVITIFIGIYIITQYKNKKVNDINIGGSFKLINQYGEPYLSELRSKKKVLYFGYTFCPDVCPIDILKISRLVDQSPELIKNFDFIFITVDPERDNQIK